MNVVIVGAGGHGRVVLDILRHNPDVKFIGFVDDDVNSHGNIIDEAPVLGSPDALPGMIRCHKLDAAIVAVGHNKTRAQLFNRLKDLKLRLISAIHPAALIARDVEIGEGAVIAAGVVISTGTKIGNDVIINTGAIIDHDNLIEDHVHISPGASLAGGVTVKKYAHVGLGVSIDPHVTIGENSTAGAGAVVLQDVLGNAVVVGVPARVIKYGR